MAPVIAVSLDGLLESIGYPAVFGMVGGESLGIPLPGETMLITAGLYAGTTHRLSIVGVLLAAMAGAIIGDNPRHPVGAHLRARRVLRGERLQTPEHAAGHRARGAGHRGHRVLHSLRARAHRAIECGGTARLCGRTGSRLMRSGRSEREARIVALVRA